MKKREAKLEQELRRGVLQIAVLALTRSPTYGYQLLKDLSLHGLETEEGTLYPLLRRLESQGLLRSEWDTGGTRPRKYYVLSEEGVKALPHLEAIWREISSAVGNILSGSPLELTEADTQ